MFRHVASWSALACVTEPAVAGSSTVTPQYDIFITTGGSS
jgi:hypothetical protein